MDTVGGVPGRYGVLLIGLSKEEFIKDVGVEARCCSYTEAKEVESFDLVLNDEIRPVRFVILNAELSDAMKYWFDNFVKSSSAGAKKLREGELVALARHGKEYYEIRPDSIRVKISSCEKNGIAILHSESVRIRKARSA